ncbi:hypothetical protein [Gloeocapsopsis dulcis]|uniref:hypothetical protein n=1 Tax=Gloeocapsopsis dulcis TaxID=2859516 RepID=UPI0012DAA681|nr:hypothetical protein [Gloeocapsopsis dulcis]WNN91192.1 hypothetical protein P0S91_09000 [Gloeocapsopsis dulcis]
MVLLNLSDYTKFPVVAARTLPEIIDLNVQYILAKHLQRMQLTALITNLQHIYPDAMQKPVNRKLELEALRIAQKLLTSN